MDKLFKIASWAFIWNVLIGLIFIVFDQKIFERTDITLLVGIGSIFISSLSFIFGVLSLYIFRAVKIIIARRNQKS